jgi:hypothetical protein
MAVVNLAPALVALPLDGRKEQVTRAARRRVAQSKAPPRAEARKRGGVRQPRDDAVRRPLQARGVVVQARSAGVVGARRPFDKLRAVSGVEWAGLRHPLPSRTVAGLARPAGG